MKIEKRYYTVEELARSWQWEAWDVEYLLDNGLLLTTRKLAAQKGKSNVRIVPCYRLDENTIPRLEKKFPNDYIEIVGIEPGETAEEAEARMLHLMGEDGDLDMVITAEEAQRFRCDNPEYFSDKRGPKGGPRDSSIHAVIVALALAGGYKRDKEKQRQGWMKNIITAADTLGIKVTDKTVTKVIEASFDALDSS